MTAALTSPPPPWLVKDLGEIETSYIGNEHKSSTEDGLNSASRTAITVGTYFGVAALCMLLGIWLRRYHRDWLDMVLLKESGEDAIGFRRRWLEFSQSAETQPIDEPDASSATATEAQPLHEPEASPAIAADVAPEPQAAMPPDIAEGTEMQEETRAVSFELSPDPSHSHSFDGVATRRTHMSL